MYGAFLISQLLSVKCIFYNNGTLDSQVSRKLTVNVMPALDQEKLTTKQQSELKNKSTKRVCYRSKLNSGKNYFNLT